MLIYLMSLDTEKERIKFVKIYDTYRNRMHYTANMILKDELNAEDMVHDIKSVYLIATRDLSNLWLQFFYLKIKGLCDFLRKRF